MTENEREHTLLYLREQRVGQTLVLRFHTHTGKYGDEIGRFQLKNRVRRSERRRVMDRVRIPIADIHASSPVRYPALRQRPPSRDQWAPAIATLIPCPRFGRIQRVCHIVATTG